MRELAAPAGVGPAGVLVLGDEFGSIGGVEGSDQRMLAECARGAVFASVGPEPGGVPPGVVHAGGGPARFRTIVRSVAALRERVRRTGPEPLRVGLPLEPCDDPDWLVARDGLAPARERELESLLSVGNGYMGSRGSIAVGTPPWSAPATFVAGVFGVADVPGAVPELAVAPDWKRLRLFADDAELRPDRGTVLEYRRVLDMRQGAVWCTWRHRDPSGRTTLVRTLELASLADRHLLTQCVEVTPENWTGRLRLEARLDPASPIVAGVPSDRATLAAGDAYTHDGLSVLPLRAPGRDTVVAMAMSCRAHGAGRLAAHETDRAAGKLRETVDLEVRPGATYRLDRTVCAYTSRDSADPVASAAAHLRDAVTGGADRLARAHAAAWRERWQTADVRPDGDPEALRALRFAAYHLVCAANPLDEHVSVGARTLTGDAYKGHVFWDTDVFMVPFFACTDPAAARALLMYRWHTLPAARDKAQSLGCRGALYAWESADSGEETTPRTMLSPDGELVPVLSGVQEHHISADVAYAVWQYWLATGDDAFLEEAGAEILMETARFWATRGSFGADGRYHIAEVIGPDEYHEGVDDDAYTNAMAQWNLRRAAETARRLARERPGVWQGLRRSLDLAEEEIRFWEGIAAAMYTGLDPDTGLHEQFRGFHKLREHDLGPMRAAGRRAAALDALLGREAVHRSKIVKQADVVMLLDLLWDEFPPRVREAGFRHYEPRTCHGSSLSPATHALVAARLGDMPTATQYFLQAARIDLRNGMGNASGGVHAAALGGLWRAAVLGFAGVQPQAEGLAVTPHLPDGWRALVVPLVWRDSRLRLEIDRERLRVRVESGPPVRILTVGPPRDVAPGCDHVLALAGPDAGRWVYGPHGHAGTLHRPLAASATAAGVSGGEP